MYTYELNLLARVTDECRGRLSQLESCPRTQNGSKFIEEGKVDMIAFGWQSFAGPYLPKKLREGRESDIKWCTLCDNCLELLIRQRKIGCCTFKAPYEGRRDKIFNNPRD